MANQPFVSPESTRERQHWQRRAEAYAEAHRSHLTKGMTWGVWQIPEGELGVLGDVAGKDVLDLGCGTAPWCIGLAKAGARPTGLDVSPKQLSLARQIMEREGCSFPVIEGSAERIPFPERSFDIVLSDHGAFPFVNPELAVPEVARVLRIGGLFVMNFESPIAVLCWEEEVGRVGTRLVGDYYNNDEWRFRLRTGEWIRLFRRCGLQVEDLIEPQPPAAPLGFHERIDLEWARRWPVDQIWKVRKSSLSS